ncbi:hypothetical protein D9756_004268 [Leucocoprinus leucothites]|uniref:Cytochrome P450 n=1 Tax=Leucocoprinus leucothites TaxID=201217 RepID=A0A8H5D9D9_9AGAR|nr:hypothetical protein D9756_004268 [Leucoagaricus leucothites]
MDPPWLLHYFLLSSLTTIIPILLWRLRRPAEAYPPGPPGLPILGNFFDMPTTAPWIQFAEWGKKYGPVIYLNLLGRPLVVLNSAKATVDLLERRGGKYADRPSFVMAGEIVGYKDMMIMSPHNRVYREQRKLISGTFGKDKIGHFHEYLEAQTTKLALSLLDDPKNAAEIVKQHTGTVLLKIIYGLDAGEEHAHHITTASQCAIDFLNLTLPGKFLVDSLPFLRHVPSWVPFSPKRQAIEWCKTASKFRTLPYYEAKQRVLEAKASESFLSRILARRGTSKLEKELDFPTMTSNLLLAGTDTTCIAIQYAIIALINHQDIQRQGQAEIDKVIGSGSLPTLKDRENLPYVTAFCKEVLRLNIPAPLGFIHVASSDDVYEGQHIPAGTMVMSNTWEILRDPQNFQDPWEFNPDRFIAKTDTGTDLVELGFGSGRRHCPGKHIALDLLFITVATFLAVFDICPSQPLEPSNFPSGFVIRPETFNCIMTPRSPDAATLLKSAKGLTSA